MTMSEKSVSKASNPPIAAADGASGPNGSRGHADTSSEASVDDAKQSAAAGSDPRVRDPEYWDELDESARETDSPDATEAIYLQTLATDELDTDTRRMVAQRAVEFLEEWYEDTAKPIAVLTQSITKDAGNAWALEKLSLLLTLAERWDDLLGTYDQALLNAADDAQKIHLLEEASRIAKDFAGQSNRASDYLKQLLILRADDTHLASSLERRLEQQERFADLVDVWRARLDVVSESEATELKLNIARTLLEPLGKAEAALREARELLESKEADAETCQLLERLAELDTPPIEVRRAALDLLKDKYAADERTDDTIRVLKNALKLADDPPLLAALYSQLVDWLEIADQPAEAQVTAGQWLSVSPGDEAALTKLQSLAKATGDYQRLASSLVFASEQSRETKVRVQLQLRAADVFRELANIHHSATELYARVLLDPETADADRLLAARQLRELLTSPAQAGQRLDVLEKLSVLEPDISAQSEVLREAARLAEELGDDDRSLRLWKECLDRDATDKLALDSRVAILARCERWPALLDALVARTQHPADDDECRADWVTIASLYFERLSNPQSAIETWRHIEKEFGRNDETVDALYQLCSVTENWKDAVKLLSSAAEDVDEVERRTELLARLGDILRTHLSQPEHALTQYQTGLLSLPGSERCRQGVAALLAVPSVREAAAETLADAFRSSSEWNAMLDLLDTRIDAASSNEARQRILLEAAQTCEQRLNDQARALEFVTRAFQLSADEDVEVEMLRLAEDTDNWRAAIDGYQRALTNCSDPRRTAQLLFEQGRLHEDRLQDWAAALAAYRRVVELDRTHLDGACAVIRAAGHILRWHDAAWSFIESARARQELDELLVDQWETIADTKQSWTEALAELEASLRDSQDLTSQTAHDVKFQLAVWQHSKRNDVGLAQALLIEAVSQHKAEGSLRLLAELQRTIPSADLVTTLLQLSELSSDPLAQLDEAAHVALEVVGDTTLAKPILERALGTAIAQLKTDDTLGAQQIASWCVDRLVEIAVATEQYQAAFQQLTEAAKVDFPAARVCELQHAAAAIATDNLGEHDKAIELCERVLSTEPDRLETISLLARLYEHQGQLDKLVELYLNELTLPRTLEHRLAVRLDLARVLGLEKADVELRVTTLTDNLKEEPGHEASIAALTDVLMNDGQAKQLYAMLGEQAKLVTRRDSTRASAMYAQAGQLARTELKNDDDALESFRASVSLSPSCPVLDALAEIHDERNQYDEAVLWLKQRLELTPIDDRQDRSQALVRLGEALRNADQIDEAVQVLNRGLSVDASARNVRALLISLEEGRKSWPELATLLAEGVPFLEDDEQRVEYLSRAADVRWHRLGDTSGAIPLLEQAVRLSPTERSLRLRLGEAARLGGQLDQARALLSELLDEFGRRRTPERANVHYQLALIDRAEQKLDSALEHLDAASGIQRADATILRTLADVSRQKGELERAETAYRALLLLVGRNPTRDSTPPSHGQSAILYELYRIASEKSDEDRARDLLDSALEKSEHPAEAALLENTLRQAQEWELLHQALERRQSRVTTPEDERALMRDRAEVLTHLGRPAESLELRLKLLALDPSDADALQQAAELAERSQSQERFRHAVIELAEKLHDEQPEVSCQLWLRLGNEAELQGDLKSAANYYERAQLTEASPDTTFEAATRVHQQTGDMHGLTLALERFVNQAEGTSSPHLPDALFRLAEVELCTKAGRDQGTARLESALEHDPNYERALIILKTAVEVVDPTAAMLKRMESLARAVEDNAALLLALFHSATRGEPTLSRLEESVELARELGDSEKLEQLLQRTIDVAEKSNQLHEVVWALTQLAQRKKDAEDWDEARKLLAEAARVAPKKQRFELRLEVADLLHDRLDSTADAAKLYEKLAQTAPSDPRTWRPLVDIYRSTQNSEKLEACLSRAEEHASGDEERSALRLERIRLMIDAKRHAEAEEALRRTLEDLPHHGGATDLLIEMLEEQERVGEAQSLVAESLTAAIDRGDDDATVRYALRLGEIHEIAEEPEEALAVYRQAQAAVRKSEALINAVLRLLPEEEREEKANLIESLIPAADPERAAPLALTLADLRAELDDDSGQERAMELGFKSNPENDDLRARLEAWYRERDHWSPLVDLLIADAEQRQVPEEALNRYLEAATIYDQNLADAFAAGDVLLKALDLAPTSLVILEPLTQYLTTSGRGEQAVEALTRAIDSVESPDDLPPLHHMRAIARSRADASSMRVVGEAIDDLDAAISAGRPDCEALLADLLEQHRQLASSEGESEVERGAVLRLASLLPTMGRPEEAVSVLVAWTVSQPDDIEAVRMCAELAATQQDWHAATDAYLRLFDLSEGAERIEAGLRYADAQSQAGDPMAARSVLERLYGEHPTDERLGERLRHAYESTGANRELAELLLKNAAQTDDVEHKYRFLMDAGELLVATGEPHAETVNAMRQALELKPKDHRATLALSQGLTLQGDIEGACAILGESMKEHGKRRSPQLSQLQHGMARIAQIAQDDEGRLAWLEAALQSDRKNGVVASELAVFSMNRGDYDTAIKALQLVTLLKEDCPMSRAEAYLLQGKIFEARGDKRKAALLAKRALTADGDYEPAREFLNSLGL